MLCPGEDSNLTDSVYLFHPVNGIRKSFSRLSYKQINLLILVPRRGLEPPRPCGLIHLKDKCLPVSTPGHTDNALSLAHFRKIKTSEHQRFLFFKF